MAVGNFDKALEYVLKHEGGYVNHPKDPGGATNKGITQRTFDAYTGGGVDVRDITDRQVADIYKRQYWDAVRGDDLPDGVDYAVFDFAVNSGPARAAKFLQGIVGVDQDGFVGMETIGAVKDKPALRVIVNLCDKRLAWLKGLSTWSTFGKGWERRVEEVTANAQAMVDGGYTVAPTEAPGKTGESKSVGSIVTEIAKSPTAGGIITAVTGGVAAITKDSDPIQWGVAFGIVVLVGVLAWRSVSAR